MEKKNNEHTRKKYLRARPIYISFTSNEKNRRSWMERQVSTITLLVSAITFALMTNSVWRIHQEKVLAQIQLEIADNQLRLRTKSIPQRTSKITKEELIKINDLASKLNKPWNSFFDYFESVTNDNTSITNLTADFEKNEVSIQGEAQNSDALFQLLNRINRQEEFRKVQITKQEINKLDPTRNIRFSMNMLWRTPIE